MIDPEFASAGEWARLYRAKAIQVVPACSSVEVKPGTAWKRPLFKSWTEFQEALVPDDKFNEWYGPHGQYVARLQMGTICGRASGGLFVIDLDTHKHPTAAAWWQGLLALHNNNMPLETPEQRTGGGGLQKLFHAPAGWTPPTCKTSIGVDIRGQGGFAMLAPSMHESGRAYAWLEGLSPDEVEIMEAPDWLVEAVDALVLQHGGGSPSGARAPRTEGPQGAYDGFGHQTDGREEYMRDLIWAAIVDWNRDCPIKPSAAESHARMVEKYEVYEREVSPRIFDPALTKTQMLDREGRGPGLFHVKWQAAMRHWDGKVAEEARRPGKSSNYRADDRKPDFTDEFAKAEEQARTTGVLEFLDVRQIKAQPDPIWLIKDLINEQSLGFVFGPPGSLKTFIALDMALSITTGLPSWWDYKINRRGAVVYLCREGIASLKFRIMAWEGHRKAMADDAPFYLIRQPLNFMDGGDVGVLAATVEAILAKAGVPASAVFVDTVSRVLPGAKENQQEDMSLFIAACEAIQHRFQCVVIGVHHTNKNGGIRGSTVIPGAGDFLIETRREPGAMAGSIVLQKIKDGEDGKELPFKVTKVDLPGIVPRSSLMVDPSTDPPKATGGRDWPDLVVCREILAAIDDQWIRGTPWSHASNTSRSATNNIMQKWSLKRSVVKDILGKWNAEGVIEEAMRDTRLHIKGYRKLASI